MVAATVREERGIGFRASAADMQTVWKLVVVNGDQNQLMRLGRKHFYPLSLLAGALVPHYLFKSSLLRMNSTLSTNRQQYGLRSQVPRRTTFIGILG